MNRIKLIVWCTGTVITWFVLMTAFVRFVFRYVWYQIPDRFYEVVNNGTLWTVRKFKPEYDPGVLQMADPGILLLILLSGLTFAVAVIFASRFAWRRIKRQRFSRKCN